MRNDHPCALGDLPDTVLYRCFADLLPLAKESVRKNWRQRYPFFVRKDGGLYVDIKAADLWLDQRGEKLFSQSLLERKRERNPGWTPAGDFGEAGATASPIATTKETKLDFATENEKLGGLE